MIDDRQSGSSNIKLLSILTTPARFIWDNTHASGAIISANGTRVKSIGSGCPWISVTSNTGWNSGRHIWKVKCHTLHDHGCDGVGVTTDSAGAKAMYRIKGVRNFSCPFSR
eukprot:UN08641